MSNRLKKKAKRRFQNAKAALIRRKEPYHIHTLEMLREYWYEVINRPMFRHHTPQALGHGYKVNDEEWERIYWESYRDECYNEYLMSVLGECYEKS